MPFFYTEQNAIYYESIGERGPWLALLNGYTRSSRDFRLLAKRLASKQLRVLLVDNRGSGQSSAAPGFTMEDLAADLAQIAASLAIEQLTVVGVSFGGVIAQCVARNYPQLVERLLLVSTADKKNYFQLSRTWPEDLVAAEQELSPLVSAGFRQANPLLFQALCKNIWQGSRAPGFRQQAEAQRAALLDYLESPLQAKSITCPSLIIHGEQDAMVPCQAAYDLQQAIPQARLQLIPEAGHLLLVEKPAELTAAIGEFIRGPS